MVMRIGGLASGMDIDALVEKLMTAERAPLNKLLQNKQKYEWQRDAYRDVNTKLKTFDTYISDNLVIKNLSSKTANSSNSDLVSAIATSKATGTLSIEGVSQLAEAARTTSGNTYASNSTKMSTLVDGAKFISFKAPGETEATEIEITSNMTVEDFVKKVNDSGSGVSAVFENGHFSFTATNTGAGKIEIKGLDSKGGNDVALTKLNLTESAGKNAVFTVNGIATERASNSFSINGYNITLKKTFNEAAAHDELVNIVNKNFENAENKLNEVFAEFEQKYGITLSGNVNDKVTQMNNELTSIIGTHQTAVNNAINDLKNARNTNISSGVTGLSQDAQNFINSLTDEQKVAFAAKDIENDDLSDLNFTTDQANAFNNLAGEKAAMNALTEADLTKTAGSIYNTLSNNVKDALATKTLDELKNDSSVSQEDLDILNALTDDEFAAVKNVHDKINTLASANADLVTAITHGSNMTQAKTAYDDALESKNNLPNAPTSTTTASSVTLTSTTNVDDMMNKIKDFVNMYNSFIKDLKEQTTQTKYRDYAPLTEDQKKDMKESEIKLWEEKAKSGLLRNDSLLRDGLSKMRSLVYESMPGLEDSKFNTLFSIGITTTKNYNDGGALEIDEKKLREALEADPDAVARLFKNDGGKDKDVVDGKVVDTRGYLARLRGSMDEFKISIEQKAGRATMTDQQYTIGKNLIDTDKRISTWQDKLKNIEARYWKQFSAMEQAINKANQQSGMFMQQG
ncbi:flagellar filament capping protein FliD [Lysinibacillus capsici]|uniref:flagellar filament capping protein FliD n=1 Tax=Lysinibacillus capsici TaxID=2115968 RepID=UPI0039FBA4EB